MVVCCPEDHLCGRCYARERFTKRGQADVIGQCWAERICRGALRAQPAWPEHGASGAKAFAIARRLVRALSKDPRLLDELAQACNAGAASWWQRRPARYRLPDGAGGAVR